MTCVMCFAAKEKEEEISFMAKTEPGTEYPSTPRELPLSLNVMMWNPKNKNATEFHANCFQELDI